MEESMLLWSTDPHKIIRWQDGTLRSVIIEGELTKENILATVKELEEREGKKCVVVI